MSKIFEVWRRAQGKSKKVKGKSIDQDKRQKSQDKSKK